MKKDEKIRLLYVEDSEYDINLTKSYFKKNAPEFELVVVEKGEDGLKLLEKEKFDILLLDNQLPDMEGVDILEKLYHSELEYPIVVLTSVGNQDLFIKSLTLGASDYIPKTPNYHKALPLTLQTILDDFNINRVFKKKILLERLKVLYVEHNNDDIEVTNRFFNKNISNLSFKIVNNTEKAMQYIQDNNQIDAILCDLNLPDEYGLDFFKRVKSVLKNTPFIFVTGVENIDSAIASLKLGAYDYIIKDYNYLGKLEYCINNAVTKARLHEKNEEDAAKLKELATNLEMRVKERTYKLVLEIEERRKIEKELIIAKEKAEESERLKTSFLWSMSHELRTPLNAINGFSEMLITTTKPERIQKFAQIINTSGHHLLNLIEDIFTVAIIETGEVRLNKSNINLSSFLDDIVDSFNILLAKSSKNITFSCLPNKLNHNLVVHTDENKLKQIIFNLLNNALKFTEKGEITLSFQEKIINNHPVVQFEVKDTGIGIENQNLEFIFEVFRQADECINKKYGGTGIGLSVAKKLSVLLGGDVEVISEFGVGSTFSFYIPAIESLIIPEINIEISINEVKTKCLIGYTILIVEDDNLNYELLSIILENEGAETIRAVDGLEALNNALNNDKIDLVLMDLRLPELSGLEATMGILNVKKEMPIIAQTAMVQLSDKENAFKVGCVDYITKPYRPEHLIQMILKHIDKKKLIKA